MFSHGHTGYMPGAPWLHARGTLELFNLGGPELKFEDPMKHYSLQSSVGIEFQLLPGRVFLLMASGKDSFLGLYRNGYLCTRVFFCQVFINQLHIQTESATPCWGIGHFFPCTWVHNEEFLRVQLAKSSNVQ